MESSRFDDLTRSLAAGLSRRRVIGLLGGAIAGTLGFGNASAQNACSEFCRSLPPGPQRGQCRSACAHESGPFYDCEGDITRLCIQPTGEVSCCAADVPCVNGVCQVSPPPPECLSDEDCDDGDPCTDDVCDTASGTCIHLRIERCGEPDTCTCELAGVGESCTSDTDCCSGYCNGVFCEYPEGCRSAGAFCDDGSTCCSGICGDDCRCACLDLGDTSCTTNDQCCGGICGPQGCCGDVDAPCASGADCCSGICTDGSCDRGPAGTPCNSSGACQSIACCDDVCCPENHFCGEVAGTFGCVPYS